jgi:hypothetical protein
MPADKSIMLSLCYVVLKYHVCTVHKSRTVFYNYQCTYIDQLDKRQFLLLPFAFAWNVV